MTGTPRDLFASGATAGGHIGIIARDDEYLAESVAEWVAGSLLAGGGALLVGTSPHLEAIRARVRSRRMDIASSERFGRTVMIEADWLLAKFMIDGTPDGRLFRALLDEIMERLAAKVGSAKRVRAWGEMVSLLHQRGNANAAARIEALWEDALREHGFSLLCTYQTARPGELPSTQLLADVAHTHASMHVQPPAPADLAP